MKPSGYEKLAALSPGVLEKAEQVARRAVAEIPADLAPAEEPAHVYVAMPSAAAREGGRDE